MGLNISSKETFMKYIELIKWHNKRRDTKKNVFEKMCYEISSTIISTQNKHVDFNDYLLILINYHETLLLNRPNLLYSWFKEMGIDLHEIFFNSIKYSLSKGIDIRTEILSGLIELSANDKFLFYLGFLYFNSRKNDEAIASLGRIKEKDAMTWGVLGQSYLETQNINKAIECLEFATYMDSNDLQGLFLLSQCYIANQELKMSLFYLAKCWGLSPKNPEIASLYCKASLGVNSEEHNKIAKRITLQSICGDYPELLSNAILLGLKTVRPCDIKSSGFTKSLGLILGELNEKQLLDQKIKLLTHLTNPT